MNDAEAESVAIPRSATRLPMLDLEWIASRFDSLLAALFVAGFALFIASAFVGRGANLVVGDAAEHYEYVRSLMADGHFPRQLIRFPCGVAMVGAVGFIPVYLAGKLFAPGALDWQSGRALPLQIAYCIPLVLLSWAGLRANLRMLDALGTPPRIAKPALLAWVLTTNLAWYVFKEPAMTEAPTYAALSLYYGVLIRCFHVQPRNDRWVRDAVLAGIFLGLAGMVRQQNILHALSLPLVLWMRPRPSGGRDIPRLGVLVVCGAVAAVLFALPWAVWYAGTGKFVAFAYTEGHFNWFSPRPWLVLFVPGYHGLFLYHPAFLLAVAGLWYFLKEHMRLAPAWILAIAIQTYLISTWYWLSFGASVGHRGFFPILPLLLPGFVALAARASALGRSRAWIATMGLLTAGNLAVMLLVALRIMDPTGGGLPANSGFR